MLLARGCRGDRAMTRSASSESQFSHETSYSLARALDPLCLQFRMHSWTPFERVYPKLSLFHQFGTRSTLDIEGLCYFALSTLSTCSCYNNANRLISRHWPCKGCRIFFALHPVGRPGNAMITRPGANKGYSHGAAALSNASPFRDRGLICDKSGLF